MKRFELIRVARNTSRLYLSFLGLIVGIWAMFGAPSAQANEPVSLEFGSEFYLPLTKHLEGFADDTGLKAIEDVLADPSSFEPVSTKYPDYGLSTGRVWLRTRVANKSAKDGVWRLDINRQYYTEVLIYKKPLSKPYEQLLHHTYHNSFSDREVPDRMLVLDVAMNAGEESDIYIGFRSDSTTYMPLGIGTIEATTLYHNKENTLNWILNGALLAIIVFTLMMMPVIKWPVSLSFSLYILAGFIYVFHADGYTFKYLWPNQSMAINDPLNLSFMALMPVFGLTFSRAMFNFKKHALWFDRYLIVFISISFIAALFSMKIYENQTIKVIAYLIPPLGTITQVMAGVVAVRSKLLGALPYLIGASIVMSSFAYAFIAHMVPGQFNLDATLDFGHIALFTECLAFAAAIVVRLSGIRRERDRAQKAELSTTQEKLKLASTLQKAQDDYIHARKLSDSRREQLSSLSHDIQQPLASLRSTIMKMDGADEENIQKMQNAFDYLETIARNNIKSGTAVSQSQKNTPTETFPLRAVLDNVYEMFVDEAKSKGLEFEYIETDQNVTSDPIQLMRAVSNLVSNAIKHTQEGGIKLFTVYEQGRTQICIEDTGQGMEENDRRRVLTRYEKGENSDGTGLGLSIVQELSDALGLDFEFISSPGQGTKANLIFP